MRRGGMSFTFAGPALQIFVNLLLLVNLYYTAISLSCQNHSDVIISKIQATKNCINKTSNPKITINVTYECEVIKNLVSNLQSMDAKFTNLTEKYGSLAESENVINLKSTLHEIIQKIQKFKDFPKLSDNNTDELSKWVTNLKTELNIKSSSVPFNGSLPFESSKFAKDEWRTKLDVVDTIRAFSKSLLLAIEASDTIINESSSTAKIEIHEMTSFLANRDEKREAIFFTETSGTGNIKSRFVCSVESAAKAYPNGDIYLLIAYVPAEGLLILKNEPLQNVLKHYPNVYALEVNMEKLFIGSPLEPMYKSNVLGTSKFLAPHTSDILRFFVVWSYGGKFFDLDIMSLQNISQHSHFIIQEANFSDNNVAAGAFGFRKHHPVGDYMFKLQNQEFFKDDWGGQGPRVITLAFRNYTGSPSTNGMDATNLKEFVKLRYETLFPINWFELNMYFDEDKAEAALDRIFNYFHGVWGLHIGNNIAQGNVVFVGSKQAYSYLAQKYCPRAYWGSYKVF